MNYSRAFTYVFEDKNWLSKVLIAGLISLIPIVGQFYLMGWMVEIVRRVKAGRTDILPTTHFSYFLTLGLKLFVVTLIYSIPLILVTAIFGAVNGSARSIDGRTFSITISSMGFFGNLISLIVHIAVAFLTSYGIIKLAETDQIKECLNISDAYNTIKDNLSTFIIVELLSIVAGLIGGAGAILCIIGLIFTAPYMSAINGHLLGQLWSVTEHTKKSGPSTYRGTASSREEDIIEEAPFTRVDDIEKDSAPVDYREPVADVVETVETYEDIVTEEPTEPEKPAEPEEPAESHTDENDIPSFE